MTVFYILSWKADTFIIIIIVIAYNTLSDITYDTVIYISYSNLRYIQVFNVTN